MTAEGFWARNILPSGVWGCPSPLKIHPIAKVPTIVYWNQPSFDSPQEEDSLVWAVYVGWPREDCDAAFEGDCNWRYYEIPNPPGTPLDNRLERPRINLQFDPQGLPGLVIGLDDGGVRYSDSEGELVYVGRIEFIRPDSQPQESWRRETVPFGDAMAQVAGHLDYPSLIFAENGTAVVSAVGYHQDKDAVAAGRPFEVTMLARKSVAGWRSQRVVVKSCQAQLAQQGEDERTPTGGSEVVLADIETTPNSAVPQPCAEPYSAFVPPYGSVVPGSVVQGGPTVRLVFAFGEQETNGSNFENSLFVLDYRISQQAVNSSSALPLVAKMLLKSASATDLFDDFVYAGQSLSGNLVLSYGENSTYFDEVQIREQLGTTWTLVPEAQIPAEPDYNRNDFRYWVPGSVAHTSLGDYGFLTPYDNGGVLCEDAGNFGKSLSFFSSTAPDFCGPEGVLLCSEEIVTDVGDEFAFESSLAFGAFPSLGRENEAIVAFHSVGDFGDAIVIIPQFEPLPTTVYGDFDFDGVVVGDEDDRIVFCEAFIASNGEDGSWSNNPICDHDTDGDVDCDDLAMFELAFGSDVVCQPLPPCSP